MSICLLVSSCYTRFKIGRAVTFWPEVFSRSGAAAQRRNEKSSSRCAAAPPREIFLSINLDPVVPYLRRDPDSIMS
jgi:hypothetical protein